MSLHQLANHVQSAGRGEDKVLVHMTPKEVGGLQALAMANGGSLTINPETGLPEAGFLSSILPMVAGFALGPAGLGLTAMQAGLASAALGTVMTGSLGKGLMAGLGAYGGAGLGAGLAKTGTNQLVAAEAAKAAPAGNISSSLWAKDPGIAAAGREFGAAGASAAGAPAYTAANKFSAGIKALGQEGGLSNFYDALPSGTLPAVGASLSGAFMSDQKDPKKQVALIRPYEFTRTVHPEAFDVGEPIYSATPGSSAQKQYFTDRYTALTPYEAPGPEYRRAAEGGLMKMAVGGPVETMSAMNSVGGNMQYPQAGLQTALYSNPAVQRPEPVNIIAPSGEPAVGAYTGEAKFAGGGLSSLGSYSDGGRLLRGPGDGVSDSIPAVIGKRQPARLADGEFVVPARIVSEIGNGSTEAGARKLYAMMDRVQKARGKTVGKKQVAKNTNAEKYLPA